MYHPIRIFVYGGIYLNNTRLYDRMTKEELIEQCFNKDTAIEELKHNQLEIINKSDIMSLYKCESNKALKILKVMFQMGYGNRIGKEYYITYEAYQNFMKKMAGKEVYI